MDAPKPKPPVSKLTPILPTVKASEPKKTPYVRKPHLMARPFKDDEGLQKLKSDLTQGTTRSVRNINATIK